MKKTLLLLHFSIVSLLAFSQTGYYMPKLLGTASTSANTFVDGPTSGQYISGDDYTRATETYGFTLPFTDKQPLQGISAIIDGPVDGTYYIMQDNGFGGRAVSPDALLHVYAVSIDWETNTITPVNFTTGDELTSFTSESYIVLSDPNDSLTYTTVCEMTNYPGTTTKDGSTVAVDQDIVDNNWLTGYDLDIESIRKDSDGNFWFGDELGPFLIKTNASGEVIKHEIRIPNNTELDDNDYIETSNNPLGTSSANLPGSGGIEGMAMNTSGTKLYTIFEKSLSTDSESRRRFINVFDLTTETFEETTYQYKVYTQTYHNAEGAETEEEFTVNDFTAMSDNEFLVIEKDRGAGDSRTGNFAADTASRVAARHKKVYSVSLDDVDDNGYLVKTELANLMRIKDPDELGGDATIDGIYTFPMECIEAVHVLTDSTLLITNDNNYPGGSPSRSTTAPDNNEFAVIQFKTTLADNLVTDSLALVDFYNEAGGDWDTSGTWLVSPIDEWMGVTVSDNRVTELNTEGLNPGGTLSPEIGKLSALEVLKLIGNEKTDYIIDLHGSLPQEIWNLTTLTKLQIKCTNITGGIPDGIENMVNLYEINFQKTKLGGEIPEEIFNLPSLGKAYLHQSDFTGTVPESVKNATQLTRLYFHDNQLDSVPFVELATPGSAKVNLTGNFFSYTTVKPYHDAKANYGSFTDDYQYDRIVDTTVEHGASFTIRATTEGAESYAWFKDEGTTPIATTAELSFDNFDYDDEATYVCKAQSSLVSSFDIRTVYNISDDVSDHELDSIALVDFYNSTGGENWTDQGNWLTGTIDTWSNVTVTDGRVTTLAVMLNNMSGTIPSSIGYLTELTTLEIKGDEDTKEYVDITGSIPEEIWNCTKIQRLQIKFTKITGDIPTSGLSNMTALTEINFQGTKLGIEIPEEIYELPALTHAYLHQSDFTGTVPESVEDATQLKRLYLQGNQLEGPLPFVDLPADNGAKVNLTGNYFTFDDVKPYHDAQANYASFTDDYQFAQDTVVFDTVYADSAVSFEFYAPGEGRTYNWLKEGTTGSISTDTLYSIAAASTSDTGVYTCHVQSTEVSSFEILSVFVIENVVAYGSTGIGSSTSIAFNVFPNPFGESLTIESETAIEKVSIYDLTGKEVAETTSTPQDNTVEIETSGLSDGVYFIHVVSEGKTAVKKVIKR